MGLRSLDEVGRRLRSVAHEKLELGAGRSCICRLPGIDVSISIHERILVIWIECEGSETREQGPGV